MDDRRQDRDFADFYDLPTPDERDPYRDHIPPGGYAPHPWLEPLALAIFVYVVMLVGMIWINIYTWWG